MFTKYFTRVEDKFVFNISLIFWHILILLAAIAIILGIGVSVWSVVPASRPAVQQQAIPEKRAYPEPVQVKLSELDLSDLQNKATSSPIESAPPPEPLQLSKGASVKATTEALLDNDQGREDYETSLAKLRELIPPATYSWVGGGYWNYPHGQRYWDYYKLEKYRQWVVTEPGLEDRLIQSFTSIKATKYPDKKKVLDGMITIMRSLPEPARIGVLKELLPRLVNDVERNSQIHGAIAGTIGSVGHDVGHDYVRRLADFAKKNSNDGVELISYANSILSKFRAGDRQAVIDQLLNSYYTYFDQNLAKQREATDLFVSLMVGIDAEHQVQAIPRYYALYLTKNQQRSQEIVKIDQQYQMTRTEIETANGQAHLRAEISYQASKAIKEQSRVKALYAIGGGILLVVIVATMLVFLSIQRLVRRIEAKLP